MTLQEPIVLRLKVVNITPIIMGDYNARPYDINLDLEPTIRTSEIKGLWRWWFRTLIAVSFYEKGITKYNYFILDRIAGKILGSTKASSLFSLRVNYNKLNLLRIDLNSLNYINLIDKSVHECVKKIYNSLLAKFSKYSITVELLDSTLRYVLRFTPKDKMSKRFNDTIRQRSNEISRNLSECLGQKARINIRTKHKRNKPVERLDVIIGFELSDINNVKEYSYLLNILSRCDGIVKGIPRLRLITMGLNRAIDIFELVSSIKPKNELFLEVKPHTLNLLTLTKNNVADLIKLLNLSLLALILSLEIGNVGAARTRGFGSLRIIDIRSNLEEYRSLSELIDKNIIELIERLSKSKSFNEYANTLAQIINKAYSLSKEINPLTLIETEKDIESIKSEKTLEPLVPTLVPGKLEGTNAPQCKKGLFCYGWFKCQQCTDVYNVLKAIGDSTLKISWKVVNGKKPFHPGFNYNTWILGLPRAMKDRTGYAVKIDNRYDFNVHRISNIAFSVKEFNGNYYLLVYGFITRDWSLHKISHYGKHHPRGKPVQIKSVRDIVNEAFNHVYKVLKCYGFEKYDLITKGV